MMRDSSLIQILNGNKLIELVDGCTEATKPQLDSFEKEMLRIFKENKQLRTTLAEAVEVVEKRIHSMDLIAECRVKEARQTIAKCKERLK